MVVQKINLIPSCQEGEIELSIDVEDCRQLKKLGQTCLCQTKVISRELARCIDILIIVVVSSHIFIIIFLGQVLHYAQEIYEGMKAYR